MTKTNCILIGYTTQLPVQSSLSSIVVANVTYGSTWVVNQEVGIPKKHWVKLQYIICISELFIKIMHVE